MTYVTRRMSHVTCRPHWQYGAHHTQTERRRLWYHSAPHQACLPVHSDRKRHHCSKGKRNTSNDYYLHCFNFALQRLGNDVVAMLAPPSPCEQLIQIPPLQLALTHLSRVNDPHQKPHYLTISADDFPVAAMAIEHSHEERRGVALRGWHPHQHSVLNANVWGCKHDA
jgi:hypothetical protein